MTVPESSLPGPDFIFDVFCVPIVTRLDAAERAEVYRAARIVAEVGRARGFAVFDPFSDLFDHPERDDVPEAPWMDRERVLSSDLLVHLSHYPARASGTGESWNFAHDAGIPQLIVGRGPRPARRLLSWTTAPKYEAEYVDHHDLRIGLAEALNLMRPFLTERRLGTTQSRARHLASRVIHRRKHLSLTPGELAAAAGLDVDLVGAVERAAADPTLSQLGMLAVGLKMTLAELTDVVEGRPRLYDVD